LCLPSGAGGAGGAGRQQGGVALYRRVGFEEEGHRQRAVRVDGVCYDDIMMAVLLDAAP